MKSEPDCQLGTSLRSRPAAQTLRLASALLPRMGVSQVFDATPLDHLGLPVFMSVRPRGNTARVHSGKGLSATDARVGAVMEALEFSASESASAHGAVQRVSLPELMRQWPEGLGMVDFAPQLGVRLGPGVHLPAVGCELLTTRRKVLLPAELVLWPAPRQRAPALWGSSTNGLASGNTLAEATLHALLEVMERDTVALHMARDESAALVRTTLPQPFANMASAWRRRGVWLFVRHLPNALGLPCFEAGLHDPAEHALAPILSRGWGLHFDRHVALSRAVCEAAQTRLSVILARRPDQPGAGEMASRLDATAHPQQTEHLLAWLTDSRRRTRFETTAHSEPRSIQQALNWLLRRLPEVGLGPVFRHRLYLDGDSRPLRGLHVVKVVVARSETPLGKQPRIGPRLFARLKGA